jgi:hypothetical protein
MPEGCAVDVLVNSENRYAVRVPVTGIRLSGTVETLARPMAFSDPYAIVDDASLPAPLRDAMRNAGQIVAAEELPVPGGPEPARRWLYTQGIDLETFSDLMRLDSPQGGSMRATIRGRPQTRPVK